MAVDHSTRWLKQRFLDIEKELTTPICPKCGADIACLEDSFCRHCGEDLGPLHSICPDCGFSAIVPVGAVMNYCPQCSAPWPGGMPAEGKRITKPEFMVIVMNSISRRKGAGRV